ncbi:hypothetical protein A9993_07800 [Rahnella victoriana]|uniref:thioredoxin reductase n=1 Tax=Rahnella victoriana TaxID=1510570 RepID=UPI000BB1DFFB|nr:thioredoxin reductase [Rahnella victoriana]PBI79648.1 hypothetical protein A9993_07800 [Rahnella victoriana]
MNINFECKDIQVRPGYRPGEVKVTATDAALFGHVDDKQILNQLDIKEVLEWLDTQGYLVALKREDAA